MLKICYQPKDLESRGKIQIKNQKSMKVIKIKSDKWP